MTPLSLSWKDKTQEEKNISIKDTFGIKTLDTDYEFYMLGGHPTDDEIKALYPGYKYVKSTYKTGIPSAVLFKK